MAEPQQHDRPLSPFMIGPYYRPQMTSMTSIINRITGSGLIVGAFLVVWWLIAAATGPAYFARIDWLMTSLLGDLVMTVSVWALWWHTLGGIRHLIWDSGHCLEVDTSEKLGYGIIAGSLLLTLITVIIV